LIGLDLARIFRVSASCAALPSWFKLSWELRTHSRRCLQRHLRYNLKIAYWVLKQKVLSSTLLKRPSLLRRRCWIWNAVIVELSLGANPRLPNLQRQLWRYNKQECFRY
jgi:hypothetical protein